MQNNLFQAFLNPSAEFSPIPFWFWNDTLSEAEISGQIEDFFNKGVMGFVIHPRKGLPKEVPYLSDSFMHYVAHAVKEAQRRNMYVVLYDEAMYPSGSAHGMVVRKNPEYATRALYMKEFPLCELLKQGDYQNVQDCLQKTAIIQATLTGREQLLSAVIARKNNEGKLLPESLQIIHFDENIPTTDFIKDEWYLFLLIEGHSEGTIRGVHLGEDDGEPDAPASADLLNPDAMAEFIHITYDRYYEVLKEYFGNTILAMFTDEPDVLGRNHKPGGQPWTPGFADIWQQTGGSISHLPLLWLDAADDSHKIIRLQYQKSVYKRLSETYYHQISEWCASHQIALTGHPAKSDDIGLLKYFQIPGQDLVWRWVEPENKKGIIGRDSTMAKCSSDAARHSGKRRNSNECFGCCGPNGINWAFTADDMKWYLDWMFVRGVNLLYPHAFFYSIEGEERFGERPPDVGPNNTFWPYYKQFADYIKRMCWLMTDSYNTTPIAVLCREDHLPWEPAEQLFYSQLEFNYLEESLLADGNSVLENGWLKLQKQAYRIILVNSNEILAEDTKNTLETFAAEGGHIIYWNKTENLISDLRKILDSDRECSAQVQLLTTASSASQQNLGCVQTSMDIRLSHVIKENCDFYLFTNEGENRYTGTALIPYEMEDTLSSCSAAAEMWDPWNGTRVAVSHVIQDNKLAVALQLERRESVIICIDNNANHPESAADIDTVSTVVPASMTDLLPTESQPANWTAKSATNTFKLTELSSWTHWHDMESYSGTITYEASFDYNITSEMVDSGNKHIYIDLGEVHEYATLTVNNRLIGTRLWAPYRFDVTEALQKGQNTLRIDITNTPANRIEKAKLPSGLLGPVKIISK